MKSIFQNIFFKRNIIENQLTNVAFIDSPSASAILDKNGMILSANNAFKTLTGYEPQEIQNQNISLLKSGEHNHHFYKSLWAKLHANLFNEFKIWNLHKNGSKLLLKEKVSKVNLSNQLYFIVTFEDITEETRIADKHKYLATHDSLTGLANRALLLDRFEHALHNSKRTNTSIALLICDLNEFKDINDNYGHNCGDYALKEVSNKLASITRTGDTLARYGGDEFVIILENIQHSQEVGTIVQQIKSNFPLEIKFNNENITLDLSLGASCYPRQGDDFEELMHNADLNMYENKSSFYNKKIS